LIGLANAGGDHHQRGQTGRRIGISQGGQTMVAFLLFINDVHGMGLKVAQGLQPCSKRSTGTWTMTARAFASVSGARPGMNGKMPSGNQAGCLCLDAGVSQRRVAATAATMPGCGAADEKIQGQGQIGRRCHDPSGRPSCSIRCICSRSRSRGESGIPLRLLQLVSTTPADQAFRPMADGGCSLVKMSVIASSLKIQRTTLLLPCVISRAAR